MFLFAFMTAAIASEIMSEWISVKDRLPENYTPVVCWYSGKLKHKQSLGIGVVLDGCWCSINGSSYPDKPDPTHWIELKKP